MKNKDKVTVRVRCFIPRHPDKGYELGMPFEMDLPRGTTLGELSQGIVAENIDELGIMAVNGEVAPKDLVLSEGDKIDFYALIEGG
jgi:sulfur carrier protein ThiS